MVLFTGLLAAVASVARVRGPEEASATPDTLFQSEEARLRHSLDSALGELNLANAQLDRWSKVSKYSSKYGIGVDLAGTIFDVALAEGIEPELGFRLVSVESQFNERATSPVGAVGLAQVMVPTARFFDPKITRARLYDRETNLRIGFRYLRTLIAENDGNVKLALLVYNRGPVAVQNARRQGINPSNGYDRAVTRGYQGSGVVD